LHYLLDIIINIFFYKRLMLL